MGDKKSKKNSAAVEAAQMPQWSGSQFSLMPPPPIEHSKKILNFGSSNKIVVMSEGAIKAIEHDDLKQGSLYIVKIRNVSVALFQGWDDDMCCFAVLRSDSTPMRWSEARYIPGDFDAYDAFDDAGNPPVHLWSRYLRVNIPINWFSIFEEARRKQRSWMREQNDDYYYPAEQPERPAHSGRHTKGTKAAPVTPPSTDKSSEDQTPSASEIEGDDETASIESSEDQEEVPTAGNDDNDHEGSTGEEQAAEDQIEPVQDPMPTLAHSKSTRKTSRVSSVVLVSENPSPSKSEISTESAPAKKGAHTSVAITSSRSEASMPAHTKSVSKESAAQVVHDPHHHHQYQPPPGPKYLNTPPTSPMNVTANYTKGNQPAYQPQMSNNQGKLFSSTDFAFPHNETQFSIQENNFPESPVMNSTLEKTVAHVSDAPIKSKRRSMQGFFRK